MTLSRYVIFLLLISALFGRAQSNKGASEFEGRVTYKITYTSKGNFDVSHFSKLYGDQAELFYRRGNFRFDFNGTETKSHIYRADSNKRVMLVKQGNIENIITTDLTKPLSYLVRINQPEGEELTIIQSFSNGATSRSDFRFDSDRLSIDPVIFRRWHYNHLNTVFEISRSIWTEHRIETNDYVIHWRAVGIGEQTIDKKIFYLEQER